MMTLLDVLEQLGQATWQSVWVPILVWTVFVAPLWFLFRRTDRLHPLAEYRLSQVLLGTLPLGVLAVALINYIPVSTAALPLPEVSAIVGPSLEPTEATTSTGFRWTWMQGLGLMTTGALAMGLLSLGRLALDALAASRVYVGAEGTSSREVQATTNHLAESLGVSRPVRALLSSKAVVPVTLGGPRPTILLPEDVAEKKNALRVTLVHECIHIRRYDDVAHVAERFVAAVFAIHPLVRRLCRHIAEARERACDAAVLNEDRTAASTYARLLAAFAERPPSGRLGTLALSETESSLTNRLAAMRSSVSSLLSSPLALGSTLLGLGLVLTFGVVACSDSMGPSIQTSPEPPSTEQSSSSDAVEGEVYMVVEDRPKLVGGMEALREAVTYPKFAEMAGIEGRVFVQFIVDEQGNVQNPKVTRGVHKLLNEAAIEAVKQQEFEPGKQRGKPVKVQMSMPVTFKLPDDSSSTESETASSAASESSKK